MSDPKPSLEEQVALLRDRVEVIEKQLERTERAVFLILASSGGKSLEVPEVVRKALVGKVVTQPVPRGFFVRMSDGADVGEGPKIVTLNGSARNV